MTSFLDYLSNKYHSDNVKVINERLIELSSLFEISQLLNSSLQLVSVLNNILLIPMGRLMISKGLILLRDGDILTPKLWKGLSSEIKDIHIEQSILPDSIFISGKDVSQKHRKFDHFLKNTQLTIAVPIKSKDQVIGVIIYGNKLSGQRFTKDERDFLNSLANLSSTAIENALKVDEIQKINLKLDERLQQLKTLFDIAQGLSATLDSEKIIKLLTYAFMGQMLVNHYAIIIQGSEGLHKLECKGLLQEQLESIFMNNREFFNITSAIKLTKSSKTKVNERLLSIGVRVIIPMRHQNKSLGFILLGEKINKQPYTEADLEFLTTLVNQAVISLENARLFKETLEKQRIEQELQVAKAIQKKLLPREIIKIKGYEIWGENESSKEVGGDYFDIIPISQNRYAFTIADVSGKSVPAALIMANLQAGLRAIIEENLPLDTVVSKLNNLIHLNTDLDKYITFFIGILDIKTNDFYYVNAGHNPPILLKQNNKLHLLEEGGIILGMMSDFKYKIGQTHFNDKDILLCYTDGVNEAMNIKEEEFGVNRLQKCLIDNQNLSAHEISDTLIESIHKFAADAPQYDDVTLLIVKRNNLLNNPSI